MKKKSKKTKMEISALKQFSDTKKKEFELQLKALQVGHSKEDFAKRGIGFAMGRGLNPFGD